MGSAVTSPSQECCQVSIVPLPLGVVAAETRFSPFRATIGPNAETLSSHTPPCHLNRFMSGNYKLDVDEIINPVRTADQHATVAPAPAPAPASAKSKGGGCGSVSISQTWGKPAAKHGAALFLLSLVVGVSLAVYASVARNSTAGLASVLLVSCGLCLIAGGLCLTTKRAR
jgi:hypothetical protein